MKLTLEELFKEKTSVRIELNSGAKIYLFKYKDGSFEIELMSGGDPVFKYQGIPEHDSNRTQKILNCFQGDIKEIV